MCFSATVSFVAGAGLGAVGAVCLPLAKTRGEKFVAFVPLFFGVQQLLEGVVWISPPGSGASVLAMYGFMFFAYIFWPVYAPAALYMMESSASHKQRLRFFLFVGIAAALYFAVSLLQAPASVEFYEKSVRYVYTMPVSWLQSVLYAIAVFGACAASSRRFVQIFGIVLFISAAAAWFWYKTTFSSVWCFFAAVLSFILAMGILLKKVDDRRRI